MEEKKAVQEAFTELSSHYEEVVDGELNLFWGWSYHKFLEELVKHTPIQKNQKVLDIATGTLVIPRKILEQKVPGVQITGLDITESMLRQGQKKLKAESMNSAIDLTCADAMALPYSDGSFDIVVSGLASHHMNIPLMLSEMKRVLKPDGLLSIIDVGTSPFWEVPIVKGIARVVAYIYFLFKENPSRAWAEALAMSNLRTPEGWEEDLQKAGFINIKIIKLSSKYKWIPEPLSIQSQQSGRNND
ncbi:MAG: class I SAM-dependent methyltransferase [Anaerolineales bacterium]|nr:class I SAM-dependent methyltransferase [Anaerolineales bacterium]